MSFGKRASKKQYIKPKVAKSETTSKIRDDLIIKRIEGILECTDAGCCPVEYIKNKISGVDNIEIYIRKCATKNSYILHRGWLYNKLWTIEDLNEICNDKITIDDFDDEYIRIDKDLLDKLMALYQRENEPIKVTWFEGLIKRGALHMTEKQLWQSLDRLMRSGKIYEPAIGTFAPTYNNI